MIILFNLFYFLVFLLGLGCYWVLDYGSDTFNELLKRLNTPNSKEEINDITVSKVIRNNCRKGKWVLYILFCFSTIPVFLINNHNIYIFLLLLFITFTFSLISPLRNLISNIAIKAIIEKKPIIKFITKGTNLR